MAGWIHGRGRAEAARSSRQRSPGHLASRRRKADRSTLKRQAYSPKPWSGASKRGTSAISALPGSTVNAGTRRRGAGPRRKRPAASRSASSSICGTTPEAPSMLRSPWPTPSSTRATSSPSRAANPRRLTDQRHPGDVADGCCRLLALVNGGTAREAELVAGALQDNHRAVLLGSRDLAKARSKV